MAIYTVHRLPLAAETGEDETVFVKEGFAWPAFFFTGLWAFWHRMWGMGVLLLAGGLALDGSLAFLGADPLVHGTALASYLIFIGLFANDWRRRWLARRGYEFLSPVGGETREGAIRRYYDHAP